MAGGPSPGLRRLALRGRVVIDYQRVRSAIPCSRKAISSRMSSRWSWLRTTAWAYLGSLPALAMNVSNSFAARPSSPTGMTPFVRLGKPGAGAIDARTRAAVPELIETHELVPTLAIVLVGKNPASERYMKKKIEACARLQMRAEVKAFSPDIGAD